MRACLANESGPGDAASTLVFEPGDLLSIGDKYQIIIEVLHRHQFQVKGAQNRAPTHLQPQLDEQSLARHNCPAHFLTI